MDLTKEQTSQSLRTFVNRRDELLHEDTSSFDHCLKRFVEFLQGDPLAQQVIKNVSALEFDVQEWWIRFNSNENYHEGNLFLPENSEEEFLVRLKIIESLIAQKGRVMSFGLPLGKRKASESIEVTRSILIRPFAEELGNRMAHLANLVTPEERALQAVPLSRIPRENEVNIFLSHKTVDKPLVYRYYHALKGLGYRPWLDESNMPVGSNLEREVFKGFKESCAAVFFITDHFKDEKYLAAEIDYAIMQKRQKGERFAIITLRYSNAAAVPDLLTPYTYKTVENDLEGFTELIRALPIELGPIRWRLGVVD